MFDALFAKLSDAEYNVSLALYNMEQALSMKGEGFCPLLDKSIRDYEKALDCASFVRAEIGVLIAEQDKKLSIAASIRA